MYLAIRVKTSAVGNAAVEENRVPPTGVEQNEGNPKGILYTVERLKTGFALLAQSAKVVRKEPGLIGVIAFGFLLQTAVFVGLFFAVFQRSPDALDFRFPRILWAFLILAASGMVGTLASATVVATAMNRLKGREASVRDGFRLALRKFPQLVGWTFFAAAIGVIIQLIAERLRLAGKIAAIIGGVSWAVATMLVVPVLLFEPVGVIDSIKRSASLIKSRWGEGVTGYGSMALAMVILTLPILLAGGVLLVVSPTAAIIVMSGAFLLTVLVIGTLQGVFSAALYRFAADGAVGRHFGKEQLEHAFQTREEQNRSMAWRALRIAGIVIALIYMVLTIVEWVSADNGL
jgi:hypothetical protein